MPRADRWVFWAAVAITPAVAFLVLRQGLVSDPTWAVPNFHFFIVSLTSLAACFLAGLLVIAAGQLRDARIVFLALAFLAVAGIFAVHGLTTPNALFARMNPWVSFSSSLSLLVGSIFFALSTIDRNRAFLRIVVQRQTWITVGFVIVLAAYAGIAFTDAAGNGTVADNSSGIAYAIDQTSAYGESDPVSNGNANYMDDLRPPAATTERFAVLNSEPVEWATAIVTLLLFAVASVHYGRLYLRYPTPLLLGITLSSLFLFQAQVSMSVASLWQASWWEYHVLMLAAFAVAVVGMAMEYKHSGTLHGVVAGLLVRDALDQLQRGYTDVIVALVNAVEAKDVYTRGHTQRVSELAVQIGEELRLSPDHQRALAQAAMLHDIGKIGVPDSILKKADRLTDAEFEVIREHPVRGYEIIKEVRSLQAALGGIRYHHERVDGSGYPDNLVGDEIPIEARVIAVADVFDALTSARSYRDAWPASQALAEIRSDAGIGLDPNCVDALERVLNQPDRYPQRVERGRYPVSATLAAVERQPTLAAGAIVEERG